MPLRLAAWLAVSGALAVCVWGILSNHLFAQPIWSPTGLRRLELLAGGYAVWTLAFVLLRPAWFAPATAAVALLFTGAAVGPLSVLVVLLFLLSSLVVGTRLLSQHEDAGSTARILALLVGISVWMALIGLALHFPINYAGVYIAALLAPLAISPRRTRDCLRECALLFGPPTSERRADCLALALAMFALLCHLLVSLKPEAGADALAMHLMLPAWVGFEHRWPFDFRHISWAVMPLGADGCFTAVYLPGGEAAARLLNFGFLAILTSAVGLAGRRSLGRGPAFLLAALFASTPLVQLLTGSLLVENLWALLLFGAVLALDRFHTDAQPRWLYITATLLGAAMATKFGSIALVIPVAAVAAWDLVGRRAWRAAAIAAGLLLLLGAPSYMFAWVTTGNPIFPFMNHVFRSPWFDATKPFLDTRYTQTIALTVSYDIIFRTHQFLESRDGALGFAWLLLVPLATLLWSRRAAFLERIALVLGGVFAVFTFSTLHYVRYLYPAFPLVTVAAAAALRRLSDDGRALFRCSIAVLAAVFTLNIYFLPSSGYYHAGFFLNPFDATETKRFYREAAPVRTLVEYLNTVHPGEPVAFFETGQIAGLRAKAYVLDWQNDRYNRAAWQIITPVRYGRMIEKLGVTHFIAPSANSRRKMRHPGVATFLEEYTDPEYTAGEFELRRLEPGAPARWEQENKETIASACEPELVDDQSPKLRYTGKWERMHEFGSTCGGTLSYTYEAGASVSFDFTGTRVSWIFTKAFNRGRAEVVIDGTSRGIVDLYSPGIEWRSRVTYTGLDPGRHTITVRALHTKVRESQDFAIDVDGFSAGR